MNEQPIKRASFYDPLTVAEQAEIAALEALPDETIDLSDIPEVLDWSDAVHGSVTRARDVARHRVMVGVRLRQAMDALGITAAHVAHSLDVTAEQVEHWINGDRYPPYLAMTELAEQYRITPGWLLCGDVSDTSAREVRR
jgi:DNA-binding transcriptional regulator YiaG